MYVRERAALAAMLICTLAGEGYAADSYTVPKTEYGQPDFQGSWGPLGLGWAGPLMF